MPDKMRIVFVDDEPRVLEGLRRMLRTMRNDWEFRFANGGREALAILEGEPIDVIVSDMRMPGMSGVELLNEVRDRWPHVVRLALSGQASKETVIQSVGPIHQYIPKPCDADQLKATLGRLDRLQGLLEVKKLRGPISRMESLPSLPALYKRLMDALADPDVSIREVGETIAQDVSMTAKILQLVNSAFFGVRRHVSNSLQAVSLLGLETIKALAISVQVFSQFGHVEVEDFSLAALWNHSMAVGALAKRIAAWGTDDPKTIDNAMMAGMLHDVGKLVLASELPREYCQAVALGQARGLTMTRAEQEAIGVSHAKVGAYLLGFWGLPDPIIEALTYHHEPSQSGLKDFGVLTAVHVADVLDWQTRQTSLPGGRAEFDEAYVAEMGLARHMDAWAALGQEVAKEAMFA